MNASGNRAARAVSATSAIFAAFAAAVLLGPMAGCTASPGATAAQNASGPSMNLRPGPEGPPIAMFATEPNVRIRIARNIDRVTLAAGEWIAVKPTGKADASPVRLRCPVAVTRKGHSFITRDATGRQLSWVADALAIATTRNAPLSVNGTAYLGHTALRGTKSDTAFDVVNTLTMEQYLPGVLEQELYDSWEPAAYRAQAIAARTYGLWEISRARKAGKPYDMESTTASQAYVGVAHNPKTTAAVKATHGQVLVYHGRLVPAFYCSSMGPMGADGALVFPNRSPDIPPLRGRVYGTWDQNSPRYNWTATRSTTGLAQRIAAWAKKQNPRHPIAAIKPPVRSIATVQTNAVGRHAMYVVTDGAGQHFRIRADNLRHAANTAVPGVAGAGKPGKDQTLYSGQFVPVIRGDTVHFTQGHGFGHGVGMSQFGAQNMALAGHDHPVILSTYYAGAEIKRIY